MARLGPNLPAAGHVPQSDDLPARRGQGCAIRREADAAVVVSRPLLDLPARRRVPDVDRCRQGQILAGGREIGAEPFCGRQFRAVWRKRDTVRLCVASAESADLLQGGQVPEPDRLVACARGQGLAVRSEDRPNDPRLSQPDAADLFPGGDIPELDRALFGQRGAGRRHAVGAVVGISSRIHVTHEIRTVCRRARTPAPSSPRMNRQSNGARGPRRRPRR